MHVRKIDDYSFRNESTPYNLSQARIFLSDIKVILGALFISNWGEAVFDYLPNLMYIGGFEGNTSLGTSRSALLITNNNPVDIPISNVSIRQVHFPRLVEVPEGNVTLTDNPELCYIGNFEFYLKSMDQVVIHTDAFNSSVISQKSYSDCGMHTHICMFNI